MAHQRRLVPRVGARGARIVFASSPNSASCERVFALLRNLFGELQMKSLADYVQAALMLNYNQRNRRIGLGHGSRLWPTEPHSGANGFAPEGVKSGQISAQAPLF